ncbi:MAG: metal ABC transporter ATP-binding protein [Crenarchaeota archaeon]|nr:metal ABC transporter ATP-binding protein [Thermoproteota archaeon]
MPWLRLERVRVRFDGLEVLRGDTLELDGPSLALVLGPNGAGKTTLLKTIAGLIKPVEGRVEVLGEDVTGSPSRARKYVLYVPQLHPSLPPYPITPLEYVECLLKALGVRNWRAEARRALELVGLSRDTWERDFRKLSGGERQRALIAPMLVVERKVLLLDEPLTSVDPRWKEGIVRVIASKASSSLVVVTSHDPTMFLPYAKTVVLMNRGIAAQGPPEEVLRIDVLREVYGASAIPVEKHLHLADQHVWSQ